MTRFLATLAWGAASVVLAATSGCGAGLVAGAASSNSGGGGGSSSPPSLSIGGVLPLVPAPGVRRTVVVANAGLGGSAVVVQLRAAGVVAEQADATAVTQGAATQVAFTLTTAAIAAAVADPSAADLPADLRVLVGGREVAPPIVLTLA
ncbi:MAG: hypothetical protein ACK6D1_11840, partial [Planctomycetota bacterium]